MNIKSNPLQKDWDICATDYDISVVNQDTKIRLEVYETFRSVLEVYHETKDTGMPVEIFSKGDVSVCVYDVEFGTTVNFSLLASWLDIRVVNCSVEVRFDEFVAWLPHEDIVEAMLFLCDKNKQPKEQERKPIYDNIFIGKGK